MEKKHFRFFSLVSFILGVIFLLNSKIDITGAAIGTTISSGFSAIFGIALLLGGVVMFGRGKTIEEKVEKINSIRSKNDDLKEEIEKICKNLNGTVDLFLVMDGVKLFEDVFDRRLPEYLKFNKVRFTPRSSLKYPNGERKQKVEGKWDASRYALIADESWCRGNSLREVTNWLVNQGYSQEKIYSIYALGANPALYKHPEFSEALGGRADDVLSAIKAINRKYEPKSHRKKFLRKRSK